MAKIQKLSDKKKGDAEPKKSEDIKDTENKVDEEKKDAEKDKKSHGKGRNKRKGKKQKNEDTQTARMAKRMKVSLPPKSSINKKKEKRQNAKMTKPRRKKVEKGD